MPRKIVHKTQEFSQNSRKTPKKPAKFRQIQYPLVAEKMPKRQAGNGTVAKPCSQFMYYIAMTWWYAFSAQKSKINFFWKVRLRK